MHRWLVVSFPPGDPRRVHVVPAARPDSDDPDPIHEPSPDCPCGARVQAVVSDIDFRTREMVVHAGPN